MSNRKQQGKRGGKGAPIQQAIQGTIQEATHDPFDALRARGVSDEVIAARGYTPFYGKDHTRFDQTKRDAVLARWDLTDEQRSDYRSKMSKARYKDADGGIVRDANGRPRNVGQGLLIPKHKFPETELPEIAPQLRPEVGFWRPPEEHWHDASEVKPRLKWIPDKERERHLDYAAARAYCKRRTRISGKDGAPGDMKTTIDRAYSEQVNDGGVYTRTRRRKWRPTRGAYDRTRIDGERRYRAHIREEHGGASADVLAALMTKPHEHDDEAKYTLPVGKRASRRLDVHPLAYERIHDAEIVFYSIEGSIKGDAILTRILENTTGPGASSRRPR